MSKNKKMYQTGKVSEIIFDPDTGEIKGERREVRTVGVKRSQDKFSLIFRSDDFNPHKELGPVLWFVLTRLIFSCEYNTGHLRLTHKDRQDICNDLGISDGLLSRRLRELRNAGAIKKDKNSYYLNPKMVWIGETLARENTMIKEWPEDKNIDTGNVGSGITPNKNF